MSGQASQGGWEGQLCARGARRPALLPWLAAVGQAATAGTGYGAAGAGGRAAMGGRLVPGGLDVWAGSAGPPTRLATTAAGWSALALREWAGRGSWQVGGPRDDQGASLVGEVGVLDLCRHAPPPPFP